MNNNTRYNDSIFGTDSSTTTDINNITANDIYETGDTQRGDMRTDVTDSNSSKNNQQAGTQQNSVYVPLDAHQKIIDKYSDETAADFAPVIEEAEPPTDEEEYWKQVSMLRNMVRGKDKIDIIKYCIREIQKRFSTDHDGIFAKYLLSLTENEIEPKFNANKYNEISADVIREIDVLKEKYKESPQDPGMMEIFLKYFMKYTHDKIWIDTYYEKFQEIQKDNTKNKNSIEQILNLAIEKNGLNQQNINRILSTTETEISKKSETKKSPFQINTRDDYVKLLAKVKASKKQLEKDRLLYTLDEASNLLEFEKEVEFTINTSDIQDIVSDQTNNPIPMDSFALQFVEEEEGKKKAMVRSFSKLKAKDRRTITIDFTPVETTEDAYGTSKIYLFSTAGWDSPEKKITMINDDTKITLKIEGEKKEQITGKIMGREFEQFMQISEIQTFYVKKINNQFLLTLQDTMLTNKPGK